MPPRQRKQLFHTGDIVSIGPLPKSMSHFPRHNRAVVMASYRDLFMMGADDEEPEYELFIPGEGGNSWYEQNQLTLVRKCKHNKCCKRLLKLLLYSHD